MVGPGYLAQFVLQVVQPLVVQLCCKIDLGHALIDGHSAFECRKGSGPCRHKGVGAQPSGDGAQALREPLEKSPLAHIAQPFDAASQGIDLAVVVGQRLFVGRVDQVALRLQHIDLAHERGDRASKVPRALFQVFVLAVQRR